MFSTPNKEHTVDQLNIPFITRYNLDDFDYEEWSEYRKIGTTRMVRLYGEFAVQTRDGILTCRDSFIAVDSGGWPYPIAADEQARIYERVKCKA